MNNTPLEAKTSRNDSEPGVAPVTRAPYDPPAVLFLEPLEAQASDCSASPGKGTLGVGGCRILSS